MANKHNFYEPHVKASRAKSVGTTSEFTDYKTGELVTCLSQGEKRFWYVLRWNENVASIRSQYPLDGELLNKIYRDKFGENSVLPDYINSSNSTLSTDFFVTFKDGTSKAFQVKPNAEAISRERDLERLIVEKLYFQVLKVPWQLVLTDELNKDYADNICDVVKYYDHANVHDQVSEFMHLVATKQIILNLKKGRINWKRESDKYFGGHND